MQYNAKIILRGITIFVVCTYDTFQLMCLPGLQTPESLRQNGMSLGQSESVLQDTKSKFGKFNTYLIIRKKIYQEFQNVYWYMKLTTSRHLTFCCICTFPCTRIPSIRRIIRQHATFFVFCPESCSAMNRTIVVIFPFTPYTAIYNRMNREYFFLFLFAS